MASHVAFTRLPRADLPELVEAAGDDDPQAFMAYLAANGSSVADYDWDGEVFAVLLPVLAEDYDIDLETGENAVVADLTEATEASVFILTPDEREKYLEKLNPENFDEDDLREAYEDFTEEEEEDAGEMLLDGIAALYLALQEVDAEHVVVVTIS
jgi:hypothetical protein